MPPIYLDHNATTPVDPRVAAAVRPHLERHFGNPSSPHAFGRVTCEAVTRARTQVAAALGGRPAEIVFTSGGSEANNHALKGAAFARRDRGRHLVISAVEHPAVTEVCRWLAGEGWTVTTLPVDGHGCVSPDDFGRALRDDTVLASIMLANNEVGTLQPVRRLAAMAREHDVWFHTDAAQAVGKVPVDVQQLGVDLLSVAGHKLYAPKGVGALYVRDGVDLVPLVHGAGHESGRRAGTENVALAVGLGMACEIAVADLPAEMQQLRKLRNHLADALLAGRPDARVHGHPEQRLPNTLSIGFPGIEAPAILAAMADRVAASAGAACHGAGGEVSGVLAAMGVDAEVARGTVRLSLGRTTTRDDVDEAAAALLAAVGNPGTGH